jgi:hypothetical protein
MDCSTDFGVVFQKTKVSHVFFYIDRTVTIFICAICGSGSSFQYLTHC